VSTSPPILEVKDLVVEYGAGKSNVVAVDRVDLELLPGEFLGVVGESGCGKSTLCFAIAQLLSEPAEIVDGSVLFKGRDLVHMREKQLRHVRWREYSVVMQSAMNALNPVLTIGEQFADAVRAHQKISKRELQAWSAARLKLVGIDPIHVNSYPHQLSGGMRQRAMIAMALLFTPDLIIMDEPTSALDVVAQRSLMVQIKALQQDFGFAVIFVTHDISLVRRFSDRLAIMYAGQIVELARTEQIFEDPKHPYSKGLLSAFPSIYGEKKKLQGIPGRPPDLRYPPSGCRFHPRCPYVMNVCPTQEPEPYAPRTDDLVRCFLYAHEEVKDSQLHPVG
jgi:peptide/nickel transport system ATP-binding protein